MGEVAYKLELPEGLSGVHDMFHVSQLKKCHAEMADIPLRDTVPLEAIQLESDVTYEEKPVMILEFASRVTRNKVIKFCKVQWSHHTEDEATWEREEDLRKDHPHLFASQPESRGRDSSSGGRSVTSQIFNLDVYNRSFICIHDLCIFAPFVLFDF